MKRFNKAFTTAELIIVLAVIGILAAILVPVFSSVIRNSNAKSALSDARNIAEQYVMDTFGNKDAPEQILIAVYKGGQYWLYGYDRDPKINDNRLMISNENPYNYDDFKKLTDDWSFNSKHSGEDPAEYLDGTKTINPDEDGTFWLVPYNSAGKNIYDVRSAISREEAEPLPYAEEEYHQLSGDSSDGEFLTSQLGAEGEVLAYHGILLPGTYDTDVKPVTDGDTTVSGSDPTGDTYILSFSAGTQDGNPNIILPQAVTIEAGTWVIPGLYTASDATGEFLFNGWQRTTAFQMVSDTTLTAQWLEAESYTVTFDRAGGELHIATSTPGFVETDFVTEADGNVKIVLAQGTNITTLIKDSFASKEGYDFTGWVYNGALYPNGSDITVTKNMTFSALFTEGDIKVTIDPNNGINDPTEQNVTPGSSITLPAAEAYQAPEGKAFSYWSSSIDALHYGGGASVTVTEEVTFKANWVDSGFTVEYVDEVPTKAKGADITATVPETKDYPAGTESVTIGGVSLNWYNVDSYSIVMPDGSTVADISEGGKLDTSAITSGTVIVTPKYSAMQATFRYLSGGYTIPDELPATATYDLIDIRDGLTVSTYNLTCDGNFLFLGWVDMDNLNSLIDCYAPGSTYEITEELAGRTITFLAMFDEETVLTKSITFKYWDYQNYNNPEDNVFASTDWDVPVGTVIDENMFYNESTPINMPTDTFTITSKNGTEYTGYYCFAIESIYTPIYAGATGTPAFTSFTVTESTADGTVLYIPTYKAIDIGADTFFTVVTTETGWKNIDRGSTEIDGNLYGISLGGNFVLGNDITLTADNTHPLGYQGVNYPGTTSYRFDFEGIFDGLGYTVSGWGFHSGVDGGNQNVGMFSCNTGTVRNLVVSMTKAVSGTNIVGIISGENYGTIENIVVSYDIGGCVVQACNGVGTIAGSNTGTIRNCHVYATVASAYHLNATQPAAVTCTGPNEAYAIDLTGVFVGGIAGCNDGGLITLCSTGSTKARMGVNTTVDTSFSDGYNYVGGIAGMNIKGTIDQCWAYNTDVNSYYVDSSTIPTALQAAGGITGTVYGGTVQYCWMRGSRVSASMVQGGITGMLTQSGTITNCWVYSGGGNVGNSSYVGDIVSSNAVGGSCTLTNCSIWDAFYANIPGGATSYSTLSNQTPSNVGLSNSYFYAHGNGPMLTNNVFTNTWIF